MLIREINELNQLLVNNLDRIRALPFDVIVHIPRSGTIPASLLATYLVKPLASVEEYCRDLVSVRKSERSATTNRILLVDDSLRTGAQMLKNHRLIMDHRPETQIYSLAVYKTTWPDCQYKPNLTLAEHADFPYFYPWFMWKSRRIAEVSVDMDGVLCGDCPRDMDDDGERYQEFLCDAPLKFRTRFKIGAIVTSRLEKYRTQTERWLAHHGITYGALHMGLWDSKEERRGHQSGFKAGIYRNSSHNLFVESSVSEAPEIARMSGKKVWCIDNQTAY